MSEAKSYHCFFCEDEFKYQPHGLDVPQFYPVRQIEAYRVDICRTCATDQLDGVSVRYERRLVARLNKTGLKIPHRNADGLLPMPFEWTSIFNANPRLGGN